MEKITNCDQCFNFCPMEAVKCERGQRLRDNLQKEEYEDKDKYNTD